MKKSNRIFLVTAIIGILFSASSVIMPKISASLINTVTQGKGSLLYPIAWLTIAGLVQVILSVVDQYLNNHYCIIRKSEMRAQYFRKYLYTGAGSDTENGKVISMINNHIPAIAEQYDKGLIDIIKCVSLVIFSATALLTIDLRLAVVIIIISIFIVMSPNLIKSRSRNARERYAVQIEKYNTGLNSFLDGLSTVRAYAYLKRAITLQQEKNLSVAKAEEISIKWSTVAYAVAAVLQMFKTLAILIMGAWLIDKNSIGAGDLIAAVYISEVIGSPMEVLSMLISGRNEVKPLVVRYKEMESKNITDARAEMDEVKSISLKDVSVAAAGRPILSGINLQFEKNKKYLIQGKSGSGKSTLLSVIDGLLSSSVIGRAEVNGRPLKYYSEESYHQKICMVFQNTTIFHASLKENVILGRKVDDEKWKGIMTCLKMDDLVRRFSSEELTEDNIANLSGGEKQRIAVCRAIVGQPDVYLLDEVTSALDKENADLIEKILLDQHAMIIHVCHKPNIELLNRYDEIITVNDGMILNRKE